MAAAISPPSLQMPLATGAASTANTERPSKRQKLAEDAHAEISTRRMDDLGTSLEVDHMILDYLLYQAIDTCLAHPHTSWDKDISPVERGLLQVDEFHTLFRKRYPSHELDEQIQFRRHLLQFAALFTQRLRRNSATPTTKSLKRLRASNRERAFRWIGDAARQPTAQFDSTPLDTSFPIPPADLDQHRAQVLQELGVPAEDDAYEDSYYGTGESTSLLDLLPLFMNVSASCFAIFDVGLSPQWIAMATALMVQAVLEQYLVRGDDGSDAIDEAFAWGYRTERDREEREDGDDKVNSMFRDEELAREVPEWRAAKRAALEGLLGHRGGDLAAYFRRLHDAQSISACEGKIMAFLKDISQGVEKPVLVQLERGRLDGMSEEETQAFVRDCGADVQGFLSQGGIRP